MLLLSLMMRSYIYGPSAWCSIPMRLCGVPLPLHVRGSLRRKASCYRETKEKLHYKLLCREQLFSRNSALVFCYR